TTRYVPAPRLKSRVSSWPADLYVATGVHVPMRFKRSIVNVHASLPRSGSMSTSKRVSFFDAVAVQTAAGTAAARVEHGVLWVTPSGQIVSDQVAPVTCAPNSCAPGKSV